MPTRPSHSAAVVPFVLSLAAVAASCSGGKDSTGSGGAAGHVSASTGGPATGGAGGSDDSVAKPIFVDELQPLLAAKCAPCHMGKRFAFASLERAGADFTPDE